MRNKSQEARLDKSRVKPTDTETKPSLLEWTKTLVTFFSSVVIAVAGIIVTHQYNEKQLEVTRKQNEAQLEVTKSQNDAQIMISRIKAVAELIPKLGLKETSDRRFAATSLALYGKDAIYPLVATLSDRSPDVFEAAQASLLIIGEDANPELMSVLRDKLMSVIRDKKADDYAKGGALYTLAKLKDPNAYDLTRMLLKNAGNDYEIIVALRAMAWLGDPKGIGEILLDVNQKGKKLKPAVAKDAAQTIGDIAAANPRAAETINVKDAAVSFLGILLTNPSEDVRVEAVWALAKIAGAEARVRLETARDGDASEKVRKAAGEAVDEYASNS